MITLTAKAQTVHDRVREEKILYCGADLRPGFFDIERDGKASGLAVDICRALAVAVVGPSGRIVFQADEPERLRERLLDRTTELAFIEEDDAAEHSAPEVALLGAIFDDPVAVMVAVTSPIKDITDLSNTRVCLMIGSAAQRALDAFDAQHNLHVARLAFEEDVEMLDAYNAQHCEAAVGQVSRLEDMRQTRGINHLESRLLPTNLAYIRLQAAIAKGDARWAAAVRGVINATADLPRKLIVKDTFLPR
jgi:general L-amino acid transport system substrate-binding protein